MIKAKAFTIIELLIAITIVAVLATLTVVSFRGISQKAIVSSIQADLAANAKKLKLYFTEYGSYPTSLDSNSCPGAPIATPSSNYCLKYSNSNIIQSYSGSTYAFNLIIKNGNVKYVTNETSAIGLVPEVINLSNSGGGTWTRMRQIIISNTSGVSLTDYQIPITPFVSSTFTTNYNSIRFTKDDGTELPYWQESTSKYWVKYSGTLNNGTTTIRMYYDNPSAISSSDGNSTFLLFDDFNDNSFNTSKWVNASVSNSSISESGGVMNFYYGSGGTTRPYLRSLNQYGKNIAVDFSGQEAIVGASQINTQLHWDGNISGTYSSAYNSYEYGHWGTSVGISKTVNGLGTGLTSSSFSADTSWHYYSFGYYNGTLKAVWDSSVITTSDSQNFNTTYIGVSGRETGGNSAIDNIRIRNFVVNEPTHSVPGAEIVL